MIMNKAILLVVTSIIASTAGCATLTSDANVPVALSFSDGSEGDCQLQNKRGIWDTHIPGTPMIRRSDDQLVFTCKTEDGREANGTIASTVGAKIVASAVFIDFGITDAITDKHREYPPSFVIPIKKASEKAEDSSGSSPGPGAAVAATDSS